MLFIIMGLSYIASVNKLDDILKIYKCLFHYIKTAAFRKRIRAKAAIFSVFKSVNLVSKSDATKT